MKRKAFIFAISLFLVFPDTARADIEIIQKILTVIKRVQDESSVVLQKYNAAMEKVTSTYEGLQADRAALQTQMKDLKNLSNIKNIEKTINSAISNVNDFDSTRKDIQKDLISKVGQGNDTANDQDQELKMRLVLGEMAADLYANALTTRTAIAAEKDDPIEMSTTQSIIAATTAKADSITRRYVSIWELDTSYIQYYITDLSKEFSGDATQEDGEKDDTKTDLEKAREIVAERNGEGKEEKKGFLDSLKDTYKEYKDKADNAMADVNKVKSDVNKFKSDYDDTIADVNQFKDDVNDTLDTVNEYKESVGSGDITRQPFGKSSSYRRREKVSFAKLTKAEGGANE